jgi:hypothetical protein
MQPPEKGAEPPDNPATRVFTMLSAVTGMLFKPQEKHEPFGPMVMFAYGRRSAIPEDFREPHSEVLAYMAERTKNPVLRARLCDICWLLDRKRGKLGDHAGANYRKHDSWLRACRAVSQYSVQCPVSGVKPTCRGHRRSEAIDPKRTTAQLNISQSRRGSDAIRYGKLELNRPIAVLIMSPKRLHTVDLSQCECSPIGKMRVLFGFFRRLTMSFKHYAASRLLALSALATVTLTTVAQAQMNGQGQNQGGGFGNMMGGNWGWGMGGFGGIGVLLVALVFLGIAVMAFRRRTP